jgi:hypothetical protein
MKTSKKRTQSRVNAFVRCDRRTFRFHACSRHVVRAAIPSADFLHLARRTQEGGLLWLRKGAKFYALERAPESDKKIPRAKRAKTRWRLKTYPSEFDRGLYRHERANRELFPLYITFMHVNDVFFCDEGTLVSASGLLSRALIGLFAFFSARLSGCFNFFVFFFLSKKKTIRSPKLLKFVIRKAHAAISINTQTTKMPSEEQQLPEPLLDDGGNDRFVLFPLKYDAVWEMVRRLLIIQKNIFEKIFCVLNFWKFVCADVSSLSLLLPYITVQESTSVVLDCWYVSLLPSSFFVLLSSFVSLFFLNSARGKFQKLTSPPLLTLSLSLSLSDSTTISQRKSICKTTWSTGKSSPRTRSTSSRTCWRSSPLRMGSSWKTWASVSWRRSKSQRYV